MTPHTHEALDLEPPRAAAQQPPTKRRVWPILLGLAVLGLLLVPLVRSLRGTEKAPQGAAASGAAKAERKPNVRVLKLAPQPFAVVLEGLGTVTPLATVTVRSQVDGPLLSVAYKEGGAVTRGQLLAEIDPRPYRIKLAQARASAARDQAQLKNAQLDLSRYESLREQKLIAPQQLDAQRSMVDQLTATLAADQANVDEAALQLEYTRIVSPIDGVAGIRQVDPGNLVHAGDQGGIVVLTQLDPIAVVFTLPQDELPKLSAAMAGGECKVSAVSRAGDQVLAEGTLRVIDNQINTQTASVRLKAQFDNAERKLWPNQFVRARIEVSRQGDALVLPAPAIQQGPQGSYVYVLTDGDVAQMRPVQVALLQGEQALIGRGVSPGERVVVQGQEQLKPNTQVSARPLATAAGGGAAPRSAAGTAGAP